jgi:hypothetical protein
MPVRTLSEVETSFLELLEVECLGMTVDQRADVLYLLARRLLERLLERREGDRRARR